MDIQKRSKINSLLQQWPVGTPAQTIWLRELGYSDQLLSIYKQSNWIIPFETGAYKRPQDTITYEGGISALQFQSEMSIHPAGPTALMILGKSHYLSMGGQRVYIMGRPHEKLPAWFVKHPWGTDIKFITSSFLPEEMGLLNREYSQFKIKVSGAARAMLECLYMVPRYQGLIECYELMEGLSNLRPGNTQELLENCSSVKVKRLFLYMAEKAGHSWFRYIKTDSIDLGKGKRSLVSNGVYDSKYKITISKELHEYGKL